MITDYLKAGYPVLMVRTHEPERFIGSMVKKINGRTPYQWDIVRGYRELGNGAEWQEADPFDLPNGGPGQRKGGLVPAQLTISPSRSRGSSRRSRTTSRPTRPRGSPWSWSPRTPTSPGTGAGSGGPGLPPAHPGRAEDILGGLEESTGVKAGKRGHGPGCGPGAHLGGSRERPGPGPGAAEKFRPQDHHRA